MTRYFHDSRHIMGLSLLQALVLLSILCMSAAPPVEAMTTPRTVCLGENGSIYLHSYEVQDILRQVDQEFLSGLRAASSEVPFSVFYLPLRQGAVDPQICTDWVTIDSNTTESSRSGWSGWNVGLKLRVSKAGSFSNGRQSFRVEPHQLVEVKGVAQWYFERTWWGRTHVIGGAIQQTASTLLTDYLHKLAQADTDERLVQQRLEETHRAAAQAEQERRRAEEARQEARRTEEAKREAEKQRRAEHEVAVRAWIAKLSPTLKTSDDVKRYQTQKNLGDQQSPEAEALQQLFRTRLGEERWTAVKREAIAKAKRLYGLTFSADQFSNIPEMHFVDLLLRGNLYRYQNKPIVVTFMFKRALSQHEAVFQGVAAYTEVIGLTDEITEFQPFAQRRLLAVFKDMDGYTNSIGGVMSVPTFYILKVLP